MKVDGQEAMEILNMYKEIKGKKMRSNGIKSTIG
jgi:hypothetical protein